MTSDPLRRVENDLAVMRTALGEELPFDRSHAALQMLTGAFGLPLLLLPWLGMGAHVLPGILLVDGLLAVAWLWQFYFARANRYERPAVWHTARIEATTALVLGLLLTAFFSWLYFLSSQHGDMKATGRFLSATVLFVLGVVGIAWVLFDRRRWTNLTWFIGLLVMGTLMPLCEQTQHGWMIAGACILVGGTGAGMLEFWQLHRPRVAHAD